MNEYVIIPNWERWMMACTPVDPFIMVPGSRSREETLDITYKTMYRQYKDQKDLLEKGWIILNVETMSSIGRVFIDQESAEKYIEPNSDDESEDLERKKKLKAVKIM
jgi:hypothetical protein